jgi:hypothetical protein
MPLTSRQRPRPGDVIEIPTPSGLAYAQYTHKHEAPPRYGALIRVLPGLFDSRPEDFTPLVQSHERFWVFFPVGAACHRGMVRVVAEEQLPLWAYRFPTFVSGREGFWFLWDGSIEKQVDRLSEKEQGYPWKNGIWNMAMLVTRIASGWLPPSPKNAVA